MIYFGGLVGQFSKSQKPFTEPVKIWRTSRSIFQKPKAVD